MINFFKFIFFVKSYYFCDISNENTFKVNFYKVIQGITYKPKIQELLYNKEENNNLNKSEKKNKTTYKSIKFQKKSYGDAYFLLHTIKSEKGVNLVKKLWNNKKILFVCKEK